MIRKQEIVLVCAVFLASTAVAGDKSKGTVPGMMDAAPVTAPATDTAAGPAPKKRAGEKAPPAKTEKKDIELYMKSGHRSAEWNDLIAPAFETFDSGSYATAFVFLQKAYDRGCRDGLVLYRLGIYRESRGAYNEAAVLLAEAAEKIPKQYPGHPLAKEIFKHAGRALYQAGQVGQALPYLQRSLEHDDQDFMSLFMSGQILKQSKKYAEAKAMFEKALTAEPPAEAGPTAQRALFTELMVVSCELKEPEVCLSYIANVLAIDPYDRTAHIYRRRLEQERAVQKEQEIIERLVK